MPRVLINGKEEVKQLIKDCGVRPPKEFTNARLLSGIANNELKSALTAQKIIKEMMK